MALLVGHLGLRNVCFSRHTDKLTINAIHQKRKKIVKKARLLHQILGVFNIRNFIF